MKQEQLKSIISNPAYQELISKRSSFSKMLTAIMLVMYFAFILVIAFDKSLFAMPISGKITLGIPIGIGIIVISFILTGIYTAKANSEFDELSAKIKEDIKRSAV